MLKLIRGGDAITRAALAHETGLARSTVAQRVDALLAAGLIYEAGDTASTGGRRPARLAFNHKAGLVLAADLGATHSRLAVSDLAGGPQAEMAFEMDIGEGPERILGLVHDRFRKLLRESKRSPKDVRGIGVGIPGPVAFASGQPVNPPIMPGWDGFRSRIGSASASVARPSSSTTTSTSWRWGSTGLIGARSSTSST